MNSGVCTWHAAASEPFEPFDPIEPAEPIEPSEPLEPVEPLHLLHPPNPQGVADSYKPSCACLESMSYGSSVYVTAPSGPTHAVQYPICTGTRVRRGTP